MQGGATRMDKIAGRVKGARPGQQIVLFAKAGTWWVQPFSNKPFTPLQRDSTWKTTTHMGIEYAALLVEPGYVPPKTTDTLPVVDKTVAAVAVVKGKGSPELAPETKRIQFSGYEWEILQVPIDSFGVMHGNSASNVWTDKQGWLHLRMTNEGGTWMGAEIFLTRSLGYGLHSFVVHELPPLEPSTVLGMFTYDPSEGGQNHRVIDISLTQWGDPAAKNAQFTIQPYYVPANVYRFALPPAKLTHSFRWEQGRVAFKTVQGSRTLAGHDFTSGIPTPGGERVHINLYPFGKSRIPQKNGVEVVIEKFSYLP